MIKPSLPQQAINYSFAIRQLSSLLILFLRCCLLQGTFTHLLCRCWKSAKNEREHTCKSAQTGPPSNLMKCSQQNRSNRTSFWNEKKKVHFPCSLISRRQQSCSFLNQCFQEEMRSFLSLHQHIELQFVPVLCFPDLFCHNVGWV